MPASQKILRGALLPAADPETKGGRTGQIQNNNQYINH
jgi:hypothetical protein